MRSAPVFAIVGGMGVLPVFLARHGQAEPGYDVADGQRSLTGIGRRSVRKVGRLLAAQPPQIDHILTSPLVRAVQTAELLAGELGLDEGIAARRIVAEPPSTAALVDLIAQSPANVQGLLVVGHEPTMSILASALLRVPEYPRSFSPGTVLGVMFDRSTRRGAFEFVIEPNGPRLVTDIND